MIKMINLEDVYFGIEEKYKNIEQIVQLIRKEMMFYGTDGRITCIVLKNMDLIYIYPIKENRYKILYMNNIVFQIGEFRKEEMFDIGMYLRDYSDKRINNGVINQYL